MRVVSLDQVDLPLTMPVLQLLLAQDRMLHIAQHLVVDEMMDLVPGRKATRSAVAMLPQLLHQVGRNADVKRPSRLACVDVDAELALDWHGPVIAARWMLKQVQHDGKGVV